MHCTAFKSWRPTSTPVQIEPTNQYGVELKGETHLTQTEPTKSSRPVQYKQLLESIVREAAVNPVKAEDFPSAVIGSGIQETPKVSGLLTSLSTLFEDVDKFWLEDDKPDPLQIRKQMREQENMAANLANVNKVASMMNIMTQEALIPRAPPPISSKQRASIFTGMKSRLSTIAAPKK